MENIILDCCASNSENVNENTSPSALHIAIIGTGSGAFAAAIKAVENAARVSIIEAADIIGGTCVNIGCVPSKIMIRAAHIAHLQSHHHFDGVALTAPQINRKLMVAQQQSWVEKLRYAKYESILESHSAIELIRGKARFKNANTLLIEKDRSETIELKADRFLIAVGARPKIPAITGLLDTPYWTSTQALVAEEIPQHLLVLGGSVVALELAQAFRHLGATVTIMARSTLLSKQDKDIGEALSLILQEEGINVQLNTVPEQIRHDGKQFIVTVDNVETVCDKLLVATGRQSNADSLDLVDVGVDEAGSIIINDHMQTSVEHIYAAGDCTSQPQFVYVAAAAGTRAAMNMTGDDVAINLSVVPEVVFTTPQVASVGLTQHEAEIQGIETQSSLLTLDNVPRAIANMDTRGFIKLICEKNSGRILGCHLVANEGGEIIQTAALAITNGTTIDELAGQLFPYLTMVEGLKLCAQTFNKDVSQLSCCAG